MVYDRFRRWSRSGVLERLFAALREQEAVGEDAECFGLDSTSAEVHPDGTGARKTNGPQSIGKSRGGWYAKIHMVSASGRQAMIFRLSDGQAHARPKAAPCRRAGLIRSRTRLWRWTAPAKATRPASSSATSG